MWESLLSSKLVILLILICVSNIIAVDADSLETDSAATDLWFAADKGRHLVGSMLTTIFLTKICERQLNISSGDARCIGITVTFTLGIGKEYVDQKNPRNFFSVKDLTANFAGIAIGLIIMGL